MAWTRFKSDLSKQCPLPPQAVREAARAAIIHDCRQKVNKKGDSTGNMTVSFRHNKDGKHEDRCLTLTTSKGNLSISIRAGIATPTDHAAPTPTLSCNWVTLVPIRSCSIAFTVKAIVCV
jgi:hypothetical protein